jgi:hypothetical protein
MAKTLEELQDAIKNVITENDKGEITATHLQTILLDMSETLSELGGSNETFSDIIFATTCEPTEDGISMFLSEEDKAHNKLIYDNLLIRPFPVVIDMNAYGNLSDPGGNYKVYNLCVTQMYSLICNEDNITVTDELQPYINTTLIVMVSALGETGLCNDGKVIVFREE